MAALSGLFRRVWPGRGRRSQYQWQVGTTREGGMAAPYWPVIIEAGAAPQTYTFVGDVALTFGVAGTQTYTASEPASAAITFGVVSPQGATYAAPSSTALTFGVSSAFVFVAGSLPRGRGGFESSRPKPPRVVYEWDGRVSLRVAINADASHVRVFEGVVGIHYTPRSHRTFVLYEYVAGSDELVLAGVV